MTSRGPYRGKTQPPRPKTMGERIQRVRVAWGWSQAQLSEAISVPQQAVSAWERDKTKPSSPALGALISLYGLSAEALSKGRGFQIPEPPSEEVAAVATEKGRKKAVDLPKAKPGEVWEVDFETSERHALKVEEAVALLRKAAKEGAAVWVVLKK